MFAYMQCISAHESYLCIYTQEAKSSLHSNNLHSGTHKKMMLPEHASLL